jgi:hypothetical protein
MMIIRIFGKTKRNKYIQMNQSLEIMSTDNATVKKIF